MAPARPSFGYRLVLESSPRIAFDLEQLPDEIVRYGTIDDVAWELERMGTGSALAIRTEALRGYARRAETYGQSMFGEARLREMLRVLVISDPFLVAYLCYVAASDALTALDTPYPVLQRRLEMLLAALDGEGVTAAMLVKEERDSEDDNYRYFRERGLKNVVRTLICAMSTARAVKPNPWRYEEIEYVVYQTISYYLVIGSEWFPTTQTKQQYIDSRADLFREFLIASFVGMPRRLSVVKL